MGSYTLTNKFKDFFRSTAPEIEDIDPEFTSEVIEILQPGFDDTEHAMPDGWEEGINQALEKRDQA